MRQLLTVLGLAAVAGAGGGEGLAWALRSGGQGALLVYERADTDEQPIAMTCRPGYGRVELSVAAQVEDGAAIELASGKARGRYPGAAVVDEAADGGVLLQAALSADDPVLRRFADTGELTVRIGPRRIRPANGFAPAHDFMNLCRTRPAGD